MVFFLGYPENSSRYHILDISTNSVITAWDVYFITMNTSFFSSNTIVFFYSNLSIERLSTTINQWILIIIIIVLAII